MLMIVRGAALALLVAAPLLSAGQQTPAAWPKPGQLLKEGIALHDKEDYPGATAKYQAVTPGDSTYAMAQSELALTLHSAGKHEEAVAAARRAIALNPFEPQTYKTLASSLDALKQGDAALATYKQALHLFPYNQGLYFNQGLVYIAKLDAANALTSLEHSVELSPFHPFSHRLLGFAAAQQGQTAHALISWLTYLALADADANSKVILVQAERLSQGVGVVPDNEKVKPIAPNEAFADLDQMLDSKVALQKEYVSKVKFAASVVKQTQLLVEKFPVDGPADDFWVRTYGPMVVELRKGENLTAFTYLILQSAEDPRAAQWVKANKGKVDAMLKAVLPPLLRLRMRQQVVGGAPGQHLDGWFTDDGPDGLGPAVNDKDSFKHTGEWISLTSQGAVDALGRYNADGQRIGPWKVLRPDGTVEKTFNYNNKGELDGASQEFYPNGQPSFDVTYAAGKEEGLATNYNECGARVTTRTFRAGKLEGPYATYYDNGQLHLRATAHADNADGLEEGFYADGTPEYTTMLANGVKQGPFLTYYPDKTLERKGTNDKDEHDGPYIEYYPTGKVREEGRFAHGKRVGTWHTTFANGKMSAEKNYDEAGEFHGLYRDYSEAGRLYTDTEYAHGRTVRMRYFDATGKVTLDQVIKKGRVPAQVLDENGRKYATGTFVDGQIAGEWRWFYPDGTVREITHYDDKGNKNGLSEFYYRNGQLMRRQHYDAQGNEDGLYEAYTLDGQPSATGYYLAGQRHGQWKSYYSDGKVSEDYEFYKGEQNGLTRSYEPGGKLTQERLLEFDKLRRITAFDSVGQVMSLVELKPDTKEYSLRYPSGKILYRTGLTCYSNSGPGTWLYPNGSTESTVGQLNGQRHGSFKASFADGQPDRVGEFRSGQAHGDWTSYFPNGKTLRTSHYRDGEEEGEWTTYFPNGQVEAVEHYEGGALHGLSRRFNPAGELLTEKTYEHGTLVSFRGPGEAAAFQPLTNQSGPVAVAFANGKPAAAETYDHNQPSGTSTFYYASGEVFRRATYLKGLLTGRLESFYPGGKPLEQEQYLHGELNGRCRYYRPNGTIEREETYRSGERRGPSTYFDAAGKPLRTEVYWNQMVYDKK